MAEHAGTQGPKAGEYIVHHLQHLQKDFSFQSVKQSSIVDFSVFNLDSLIYSIILGVIGCFVLWRAARRATSGVPAASRLQSSCCPKWWRTRPRA